MQLHTGDILTAGVPLHQAKRVLLMLHGRGAGAEDIISLSSHLDIRQAHIIAPQAVNSSWYPYSFLAPLTDNEPWLSSALELLKKILDDTVSAGIHSSNFFILGFSQGACLSLEFAARNARDFGGVIAFTGGLIGDMLHEENYKGDFKRTKVFIGNSDRDPHVPLKRSEDSAAIFERMGAEVMLKVYPGMAHTVNTDEIHLVNKNIFVVPEPGN